MKRLVIVAALLPFTAFAQPLNPTNNPNQPGYVVPSQQRMQTQMLNQQQQQQGLLKQQQQTQSRQQQQNLQMQMNDNSQRIRQAQPGELDPAHQQVLPNSNGGMLSQGSSSGGGMLNQQSSSGGGMLHPQNSASGSTLQQPHMLP
ncbi:DUF2756 family protein [Enterobacter asburiae]|nr:DUF2756 family protein [Enterobacter asburiae]